MHLSGKGEPFGWLQKWGKLHQEHKNARSLRRSRILASNDDLHRTLMRHKDTAGLPIVKQNLKF